MIRKRYRNSRGVDTAERMRRWGRFTLVGFLGIVLGGLATYAVSRLLGEIVLFALVVPLVFAVGCWLLTRHDLYFVSDEKGTRSLLYYLSGIMVFVSALNVKDVLSDVSTAWQPVDRLTASNVRAYEHIEVHDLELDTTKTGTYVERYLENSRHSRSLTFHGILLTQVKGLKNVFVRRDVYSSCSYDFVSDEQIEATYQEVLRRLHKAKAAMLLRTHCYISKYSHTDDNVYSQMAQAAMEATGGGGAVGGDDLVFFQIRSTDGVPTWKDLRFGAIVFALWAIVMAAVFFFTKEKKRARYRQRGPGFHLPRVESWQTGWHYLAHFWPVVVLAVVCVAMYVVELSQGFNESQPDSRILIRLGACDRYGVFTDDEWWRLLSYAFLHGSFRHLLENMIALLLVSYFMDEEVTPLSQCALFLVTSVLCGFVFLAFSERLFVGASGGLFGLMGCYLTLSAYRLSKTRVLSFPALVVGVVCVVSLLFSFARGVSMLGHVTGLVCGAVTGLVLIVRQTGLPKV